MVDKMTEKWTEKLVNAAWGLLIYMVAFIIVVQLFFAVIGPLIPAILIIGAIGGAAYLGFILYRRNRYW